MVAIDGDKSVAQDAATRLKIAGFSPELYDPDVLTKLKGYPYNHGYSETGHFFWGGGIHECVVFAPL